MNPTFLQVARRPKWIAGLLLAFLIAGIFAGLMQWQLSRTFNVVGVSQEQQSARPLTEFAAAGEVYPGAYDSLAQVEVELDPGNVYVVENRLQLRGSDQVPGYWLIANSYEVKSGASLTLALAFATSAEELKFDLPEGELAITGYIQPSDPVADGGGYLGSVSLAQLVNIYFDEPTASYPIYLIVQEGIELPADKISIGVRQAEIEVNWLTAFYAVEWAFFALVAFYLWWRLVRDQVIREQEG
ncbi:MAG: SURF1 family cytochrome oxidase biogenesis protein [Pontimonas sp.]